METRARYALIGAFMLAVIAASFAFGGGTTWLTQWTTTYDHDYACPI